MEEIEIFLSYLLKKQDRIIPIIGESCFVGTIEKDGQLKVVSLQEYIVEAMGDGIDASTKSKMVTNGYYGMNMLCEEYCRRNHTLKVSKFRNKVKDVIEEGMRNHYIHLKNEVKDFLDAGNFSVVVTTNPFHILEGELSKMQRKYDVKAFVPVAPKTESKSEEQMIIPAIYQIFGTCDGEFVLTENDLLRFLHYLNIPEFENGYGANSLVKYIKEKSKSNDGKGNCILMPIGCDNLPNWLFRFLWYPLSPNLLFGQGDDYDGGVWHELSSDEAFKNFLEEYNFKTLFDEQRTAEDQTDPILRELTKRMRSKSDELREIAKEEMGVSWQECDEWDVFISYASEDKEIVNEIYRILTELCHKKVWMDNRQIRLGDRYWKAICHGIEHSQRYMFIITDAYLKKAIEPFRMDENGLEIESGVFKEIDLIRTAFLNQYKDTGYVNRYSIPLIHKGTKVEVTDLMSQTRNIRDLDGGLLEKLYKFKEYEMLRTDVLFDKTQSELFDKKNIKDILESVFNQNGVWRI